MVNASYMQTTEIDYSPKALAMGSSQVALAESVDLLRYNPAGLVLSGADNQIYSSSVQGFADMSQTMILGYSQSISRSNSLGLLLSSTVINNISNTEWDQDRPIINNQFSYSSNELIFAYSYLLQQNFSTGLNLRFLHKQLGSISGSAFAMDMGIAYNITAFNNWQINAGLNCANIGDTKMRWSNESTEVYELLPVAGFAVSKEFLNSKAGIVVDKELNQQRNISIGIFYLLFDLLEVRAGRNEAGQISYGAGVDLLGYQIDYAEVEQEYLGIQKQISLRAQF